MIPTPGLAWHTMFSIWQPVMTGCSSQALDSMSARIAMTSLIGSLGCVVTFRRPALRRTAFGCRQGAALGGGSVASREGGCQTASTKRLSSEGLLPWLLSARPSPSSEGTLLNSCSHRVNPILLNLLARRQRYVVHHTFSRMTCFHSWWA